MHLVFATCHTQPEISASDSVLAAALRERGVTVTGAPWNGPVEPFLLADAVVIRTTWDYFDHYERFVTWLDALELESVQVHNSIDILRWNIHKRYLFDLQQAGAPVLPMVSVDNTVASVQAAARRHNRPGAVLKCLVSGTARGQSRFHFGAVEQIERALEAASPWATHGLVVQPFMPEILEQGELSLVHIDGGFTHAVRKTPKAGEYRIQSEFGGRYERVEPEASTLATALRCLELAAERIGSMPLYARVDGLVIDGDFRLMELELAEPELMFGLAPESADALSDALLQAL